jgi:hypothetical protein
MIFCGMPAQSVDFTVLYRTGDALPGDPAETFTSFDAPATDGTTVSFFGRGSSREGIFTTAHGLSVVAERTTLFPGTTINFAFFGGPLVENGMTLISGVGASGMTGIYLGDGGPLTVVADVFTRVPGARGRFTDLGGMASGGARVVFQGRDVAFRDGIYVRKPGGALAPVADLRTSIPGGVGTFEFLDQPLVDGSTVVFRGGTLDRVGLYAGRGTAMAVVADVATPIPRFSGTFGFFEQGDLEGDTLAFIGGDAPFSRFGIYTHDASGIALVADNETPLPDGSGILIGFGSPAVASSGVVFLGAATNGENGLYHASGGTIEPVLLAGDPLDGRTVLTVLFQADGLAGSTGVVAVQFTDGTAGIYSFSL